MGAMARNPWTADEMLRALDTIDWMEAQLVNQSKGTS